jgi:RNA polymerase sigma-70 factor (ECF subfamily)
MTTGDGTGGNDGKPGGHWPETRWSVVLAAGKPGGEAALAELCRMYRAPVVAFLCRLGCSRQEAEDRAQGYFAARLIERNDLARVERRPDKLFRSWLCVCVKRHFFNERTHEHTAKLWSGQPDAEFDETHPGPNAQQALGTDATLDRIWDQCWAHEVMQRALTRLREHRQCQGKLALYEELCDPSARQALPEAERKQREALLAEQLGIKVDTVRVYRHRLHLAFVECLDAEIALTLDVSCSLREERNRLIQAFSDADDMLAKHSEMPPMLCAFALPPDDRSPALLN